MCEQFSIRKRPVVWSVELRELERAELLYKARSNIEAVLNMLLKVTVY